VKNGEHRLDGRPYAGFGNADNPLIRLNLDEDDRRAQRYAIGPVVVLLEFAEEGRCPDVGDLHVLNNPPSCPMDFSISEVWYMIY